ncbi:MAG: UDP-glucose 4-epimerase GalE [Candidatus Scalindua sp. AMX11]|nr:MAG: UDP-glucose 4-epimerase GalE [Candidatus Scalindua sp.]NOG86163.1 UDP-glucose 4-epimerase GalE [Planctomycetota bacterium]RZV98922.1 MAG: UDP-glucose 4-epimerase GalE [Candidatus Scalindua sp. SCAELEC01]TDE66886.1 MAG: UDP-glucose 4-epimerase GalE [Candidatus Scalindua sp. AMX11]GJQ57688.1 MAG: UDP-glucose 4-epimerase [Candidatus Scalindua sp.]
MKKIVVTGGLGYIGSHTVVELVNNGYIPIIVDNLSNSYSEVLSWLEKIVGHRPEFYQIDCGDKDAFRTVFQDHDTIQGVIHFAAFKAVGESVEKPILYYQNNLGSLLSLLDLMSEQGVNDLVFSSSCTVYGVPKDTIQVDENTPLQKPNCPYGQTKIISEQIISDTALSSKIKSVLLRYFNPIGAHESIQIGELPIGIPNNLVPFITQTAVGIRDKLSIFGNDYDTPDGTCIRDFIHVSDLAHAHVKALQYIDRQDEDVSVFNIGTGKGNSVMELVNTFEKITGDDLSYEFAPRRAGDVPAIYANVDKSNSLLDWRCRYSLEDSLSTALDWQKHLKEINFKIEQ